IRVTVTIPDQSPATLPGQAATGRPRHRYRRRLVRADRPDALGVVPWGGAAPARDLACRAAVDQDEGARALLHPDRDHQAAAVGQPVPRVDVDVPRIQARATVVGVAVPTVERAAVVADEVLDATDEDQRPSPASPAV